MKIIDDSTREYRLLTDGSAFIFNSYDKFGNGRWWFADYRIGHGRSRVGYREIPESEFEEIWLKSFRDGTPLSWAHHLSSKEYVESVMKEQEFKLDKVLSIHNHNERPPSKLHRSVLVVTDKDPIVFDVE